MNAPDLSIIGEISAETTRQVSGLVQLSQGQPIHIEINSAGGDAFAGIACFNVIRQHGQVTTSVTGLAASAAATIALAGATIRMHTASMMMIHSATLLTIGNARDHQDSKDVLEQLDSQYAELVSQVTGHPEARVRAWLEAETWLTAEEAVDLNFADEVIEVGGSDMAPVARSQRELLSKFRNVPADLASLTQAKRKTKRKSKPAKAA